MGCVGWNKPTAKFGMPPAAFARQEFQQSPHDFDLHGVADRASIAPGMDESRPREFLDVERKPGGADVHRPRQVSRALSRGTTGNQMTKDRQPILLGERGEGENGIVGVHNSTLQQMLNYARDLPKRSQGHFEIQLVSALRLIHAS